MKLSSNLKKIRIIYITVVILIILITISFARHSNVCDMAYSSNSVCGQEISVIISQKIYSIFTFNEILSNNNLSKKIDHIFYDYTSLIYHKSITFFVSLFLHYIFISIILYVYVYFKKKN